MELPNIVRTKQEEKESFRIIEEALGKDFILRKQNESDDYGIDAEIELIHDGHATGKIIKIQVKSSLDLKIRQKDNVPTVSGIKQSTLNYWISMSDYAHVVIFAVDLTHKDIYITYPIFYQATQLIDNSTQTKTIEFQKGKLSAPELGKVLRLFLLFPHPKEEQKQYQQLQDKLLPALDRRFYAGDIPKEWGRFRLAVSGETAVQDLTLLKSRRFLAYKHGNINLCIAQNRWRESAEGDIEIRQAFWPECRMFAERVPWLLVYADLLAEDDPRCNEAALEVYHRYLEERS